MLKQPSKCEKHFQVEFNNDTIGEHLLLKWFEIAKIAIILWFGDITVVKVNSAEKKPKLN